MLVSAAASPSLIKETTSTCYKDTAENIYFGGEKWNSASMYQEVPVFRSFSSPERKALEESEQSQVISPPLARAIRDYVNSLLVQGGGGSLPGTSNSTPLLNVENTWKRIGPSNVQETEPSSPPRKLPRFSEKSVEEKDSGSFVTFQNTPGSELMSLQKLLFLTRSLL